MIYKGPIPELQNISIDRFDGDNHLSTCFFLSHCHSDHMTGLDPDFFSLIKNNPGYYLYCSPPTKNILMKDSYQTKTDLSCENDFIKELEGKTVITVPGKDDTKTVSYEMTVTAIPVHHCLGSVMFLFETARTTVLYTGDFRIIKGDTPKFKELQSYCDGFNKIDKIYFDATFLNTEYWEFPEPSESLQQISQIIRDWLDAGHKNHVLVEKSARYGYEYVLIKLAEIFHCRIHVDEIFYKVYSEIPEIESKLTTSQTETRIHCCMEASVNCDSSQLRKVRLSAQRFKSSKESPNSKKMTSVKESYNVCYATHSSLSEILDFLDHLRPKSFEPLTDTVDSSRERASQYYWFLGKKMWFNNVLSSLQRNKRLVNVLNSLQRIDESMTQSSLSILHTALSFAVYLKVLLHKHLHDNEIVAYWQSELEGNAGKFFVAARTIQRMFRGYITRQHIRNLDEKAICIQKNWRAFTGRIMYEKLLKEKFDDLCRSHYAAMALTIQRHWKGYCIRVKIFSFYKLKSWLEFVNCQNKFLKYSGEKYRHIQNNMELEQREEEAKEWIVYILFKLHHLLRTQQISGIYSLPKTRNLSDIEKMLKGLRYKDFMTFYNSYKSDLHQRKTKAIPAYILQNCKYATHFEKEWHEHKLKRKDSYADKKIPIDRYTRYERQEICSENENEKEDEKWIPDLGKCECTFCLKELKNNKD